MKFFISLLCLLGFINVSCSLAGSEKTSNFMGKPINGPIFDDYFLKQRLDIFLKSKESQPLNDSEERQKNNKTTTKKGTIGNPSTKKVQTINVSTGKVTTRKPSTKKVTTKNQTTKNVFLCK
uniref:Lipoprotein n=1 Tax=Strongyloides venezuelensis TaxID=75913 RepID=A0A0K0EWM7_STRVS